MQDIAGELVENTWREVSSFSEAQVKKYAKRLIKEQPHLGSFVLHFTVSLRREAHELAYYLFSVIYRIFEKAAGKIRRIPPERIIEAYEETEAFVGSFEKAHERFLERAAIRMIGPQPFVVKYLTEALMEAPENEDPVELSDEESGQIFLVLKTVINLLDEQAGGATPKPRDFNRQS